VPSETPVPQTNKSFLLLFFQKSSLTSRPSFFLTSLSSLNRSARRSVSRVLSASLRMVDGHSSGTRIAARLARPTRVTGRKHPRGHDRSRRRPPLFGLAPGGVYPAACVTAGAVRSYRTVSPLPAGLHARAVCFLWHCPWGRPRRSLTGTVFPWSPDFPPSHPFGHCDGGRPTVWLNSLRRSGRAGQWAR